MLKNRNLKSHKGFTLIELLIVMAILALLAGLVGPTLWNKLGGAKTDTARTQMKSFEAALDSYRLDLGKYPKSLEQLVSNEDGSSRWNGPYIKKIPLDPWGNKYVYENPGKKNKDYDLYSYGRDGEEGGEEKEDQDVTNW